MWLPPQTSRFIKRLYKTTKYDKQDLYYIAFIVLQDCKSKYVGDNDNFYQYLNKSIKNTIQNIKRKKKVKIATIQEDIEEYGYEQPNNVLVNDFRKYVQENCSSQTNDFLNFFLDQPSKIRLYSYKCLRNKRKLSYNIIFDYMGVCRATRKRIVEELYNARKQYDSY